MNKTSRMNSYDLLKTLAVLLMLVDHIGFYFFFDESWWRVFGRLCVPIWFFLIGYARSRDISLVLCVSISILVLSDFVAGLYFMPFSILVSILLIRLVIDEVMWRASKNQNLFWAFNVLLLLLSVPSGIVAEYGTQGLVLAMFGWIVRNVPRAAPDGSRAVLEELPENCDVPHLLRRHKASQQILSWAGRDFHSHYLAFAMAGFIVIQTVFFGFDRMQLSALGCGVFIIMYGLLNFKPSEFRGKYANFFTFLAPFFRFAGRHTLLIYVAHLLLFKICGLVLDPERFTLFDWHFIYTGEAQHDFADEPVLASSEGES